MLNHIVLEPNCFELDCIAMGTTHVAVALGVMDCWQCIEMCIALASLRCSSPVSARSAYWGDTKRTLHTSSTHTEPWRLVPEVGGSRGGGQQRCEAAEAWGSRGVRQQKREAAEAWGSSANHLRICFRKSVRHWLAKVCKWSSQELHGSIRWLLQILVWLKERFLFFADTLPHT